MEIRRHCKAVIEQHSMYKRVQMINGSLIEEATIEELEILLEVGKTNTVMLGSNHIKNYVFQKMR